MDAVVVKREADEQRIHAEHILEVGHDRNGTPCPDGDGLVPPFVGEHGARLGECRIVERQLERRRQPEIAELDFAIRRQPRPHEGAEGVANFLRVLLANEPERNLRTGFAGNDGFGAFARIAADHAVDLGGRAAW